MVYGMMMKITNENKIKTKITWRISQTDKQENNKISLQAECVCMHESSTTIINKCLCLALFIHRIQRLPTLKNT